MTKGTFGETLKREREMRGVTLDEIAAATRIATRFLKAMENEEWDKLPGGVFNRGFVRAVARFLGLDEELFHQNRILRHFIVQGCLLRHDAAIFGRFARKLLLRTRS